MADPTAALEHRLRLAHQARRAKEHQLDDIRRALCDAEFMQDDDPYGHADLAGVIRQVGAAEAEKAAGDVCGHVGPDDDDPSNPCTLPLGHDMHRDGDGCSWPTPTRPVLDRTAVRNVILFVASATGHPSPEWVDVLTDRAVNGYMRKPAEEVVYPASPVPCGINHDCPGQPRPEPTTARGEARCQSQHRREGEPLVQCALAVHAGDAHTDYDGYGQPAGGRDPELPWLTWRDKPKPSDHR